jgi:hypothetical protein
VAGLAGAQHEEMAARDARVADARRWRIRTEAGAVGALLILAFAFGLRRREPTAAAEGPMRVTPEPARQTEPVLSIQTPVAAARRTVDWGDAAQVCVDFGRVLEASDIPPLLERAARVLEARGLVLWVSDTSGAVLRPSLAHGYTDKTMQRIGPLQADADNVTSLAFRSMLPQTVTDAARGSTRALAVPLITSSGCVGVLAAEVAHGGHETIAVARMFAAQLATLVAPVDSALERVVEA